MGWNGNDEAPMPLKALGLDRGEKSNKLRLIRHPIIIPLLLGILGEGVIPHMGECVCSKRGPGLEIGHETVAFVHCYFCGAGGLLVLALGGSQNVCHQPTRRI